MASLPVELARPLTVVDALFEQHLQATGAGALKVLPKSWGEREHFVQALGLQDEEAFARIPCLNDVELVESVPPLSLVRYRGLVQDVFEPEIYKAFFEECADPAATRAGAPPAASRVISTKYRECIEPAPGRVFQDLKREGWGQRGSCYVVPLPGEGSWARASAAEWSRPGSAAAAAACATGAAAGGSLKRSRDDDVVMEMEAPGRPRTDTTAPPEASRGTKGVADAAMLVGGAMACTPCAPCAPACPRTSDEFGLNFPLPEEEGRGRGHQPPCIVKLYDGLAEAVKLCECIEVVGVLCVDPEMASFDAAPLAEDWAFGRDARQPSASMVPRVHALFLRRFPFQHPALPFTPDWLTEARLAAAYQRRLGAPGAVAAACRAALSELTRQLCGDAVAAEYVLMLMVSRAFGHMGDKPLGSWSLNIACWPEGASVVSLVTAAAELVPRCVRLAMTPGALNAQKWFPRKDFEANRLVAGRLQLAPGTLLVLDETRMEAGQLSADGARNVAAATVLVTENALTCDFSNYDVKIPLELFCVAVSRHRSIIKDMDVLLPLQPVSQAATGMDGAMTPEALDAARFLIGLVTRQPKPLNIPEDAADQVSTDFVHARQQFRVGSELCHTWFGLARASCLINGEPTLTATRWQHVLQLERERLTRCGRLGLLGASA